MADFTTKELRLIRHYDSERRTGLIQELENMILYLTPDECRIRDLARSVIRKLECISDYEYHVLADHAVFAPEEDDYAG